MTLRLPENVRQQPRHEGWDVDSLGYLFQGLVGRRLDVMGFIFPPIYCPAQSFRRPFCNHSIFWRIATQLKNLAEKRRNARSGQ
jgi:hypothetical protein